MRLPRSDSEMFTSSHTRQAELLPIFAGLGTSIVVCGHTHVQFDRWWGATRVVNAGSVGMPFEGRGAYWLLLGQGIRLRCTAYDAIKAAERLRSTTYPEVEDFVTRYVLPIPP
jgi:predicted phosphodiesterase